MAKRIDITGKKFGKLTVLHFAGYDNNRQGLWKCRCDCGNYSIARGYSLRNGTTKSCGCARHGADIAGDVVGDYKAIERIGNCDGGALWKFECIYCGNVKEQSTNAFRHGRLATCPVCAAGLTAEDAKLKRAEQEQADEMEREARKPKPKKKTLPLAAICAAAREKKLSYGQYMVQFGDQVAQGKLP